MWGAVIGDIAGSRFEGSRGGPKSFEFFHQRCRYTDDTVCTAAVADIIVNDRRPDSTLQAWCRRHPGRGYGGHFRKWIASTAPTPYGSFGNGAAMRVGPAAFLYRGRSLEEALATSDRVTEITHDHPEGIKGARAVTEAIKQVVRDALESVIDRSEGAHGNFRVYVEKRLARQGTLDPKFLGEVLTGTDPRKVLIVELVGELTSQSLQSKDQVLRAASFFDIPSNALTPDIRLLDRIFQSRNQVSHEMDVDLNQPNRNRRPRRKEAMISHTETILQLANTFLIEVDQRL